MPLKKSLRSLNNVFTKLEKAQNTWDFTDFLKYRAKFEETINDVIEGWDDELSQLESNLSEKRQILQQPAYGEELKDALLAKDLPLEGDFPNYQLGPFELKLDKEIPLITFKFGRRTEKIRFFATDAVAEKISSQYKRIVNRPFNAGRFAKELRAAYEVANRLSFQNRNIQWGNVVSLKKVYDLLTLRGTTRREYPEPHYIYDLSRFRQSEMHFDNYRFELGTSRDVGRTYLLIDPDTRREIRISSLSIYEEV